ncbi:MAG: tetratricopeptide repeat protein [Deltaproteobacteria bacterium]|nr:tetratricopeptide repeat protein [Deltaproteobacteria bacterium]
MSRSPAIDRRAVVVKLFSSAGNAMPHYNTSPKLLTLLSLWLLCGGLLSACRSQPSETPAPSAASASSPSTPTKTDESPADRAIRTADSGVAAQPQQSERYVALASAYMQKARESGDASYYQRAEAAVQRALELDSGSAAALRTLAWVQTGKHEFRAALAAAERLRQQFPQDPLVHGLLGDAALELGDYARAETAFQAMLDLRPGLPSFSRAAYLRELYGDREGAVELMEQAVKSGSVRDPEPLAWCLVQLGQLYFNQGRLGKAETAFTNALAVFPQYYQAVAALGRVRGAQLRYPEAIALYRQAVAITPTPDLLAALGDLLLVTGKPEEAERQFVLVEYIEQVNATNQVAYTRQLALFYADHDRKLDEAVTLAEAEIQRRHDIYSFDTLAWAYYKKGRFADARQAMTQALRLGTQDAQLLFHAGMIARALDEPEKAKEYLSRALETNPYFSLRDGDVARKVLAGLGQHLIARGEGHGR